MRSHFVSDLQCELRFDRRRRLPKRCTMNKESFARLSLALLLLSSAPVWAHREGPPSTGGRSDAVPLFSGLGDYHRPIRTRSPDAQRYFDQGLRLVYAFNHDEAGRSFREAARLDPECAMAWWGVALTLGPNINLPMGPEQRLAAVEAVEKARELDPLGPATSREPTSKPWPSVTRSPRTPTRAPWTRPMPGPWASSRGATRMTWTPRCCTQRV